MPSKRKKTKPATERQTKKSFILGFPPTAHASTIVERGAAAGLAFTEAYVWAVRGAARMAARRAGKTVRLPKIPRKAYPAPKREFILSFPTEFAPSEVVARAADAGIQISRATVWKVRKDAIAAGKIKRPAKPLRYPGSPRSRLGRRGLVPTKRKFILSLPSDMPVPAVVARAAAAGQPVTDSYVWKIRRELKAAEKIKHASAKQTPVKPPPLAAKGSTRMSAVLENQFVGLVLDIGLAKARELLATIAQRLRALNLG